MITIDQRIKAARHVELMRKQMRADMDAERARLLEYAETHKVGVVHIYDKEFPHGGLTVAFRKLTPYDSGTMVEVAVATCSPADSFSKKIGTSLALGKFADGETIALPLNVPGGGESLNYYVKSAFAAMYFTLN